MDKLKVPSSCNECNYFFKCDSAYGAKDCKYHCMIKPRKKSILDKVKKFFEKISKKC